MRSRPLARLLPVVAAIVLFFCGGPTAEAMSSARISIAEQMQALAGGHRFDRIGAWTATAAAYRSAGVDGTILNGIPELLAACFPLPNIRAPEDAGGPAAGDLAVFQPLDHVQPFGVAVFVDNGEVSVWSPTDGRFHVVPAAALDGAGTIDQSGLYATAGSVYPCRIAATFWPHQRDDVRIPPGHIELVDPGTAARQIDWVELHPRDPDQSIGHTIWREVVGVVAWISGVLGTIFSGMLRVAGWTLHHIPIVGPIILGAVAVLTKRFDGTGLHRVLSDLVGGIPLATLKLLGAGLNAAGLHGIAKAVNGVADGMVKFTGFLVTLTTGLEASGDSTVGGVGIAVASDLLLVAQPVVAGVGDGVRFIKPMDAGLHGLEAGIAGRYGVATTFDRMSDLIMVRPLSWAKTTQKLLRLRVAEKWSKAATISVRTTDFASLIWRPGSALNEAVDQLGNAFKAVAKHSDSVERAAAATEKVNQVLHAASGAQHLDQMANSGSMPTVRAPVQLRPHRFPGLTDR